MRKAVALLFGLALLLSACGRESSLVLDRAVDDPAQTPRPTPTPAAAPVAEDPELEEEAPEETPEPTPDPEEPPPPPPTAEPGSVNLPNVGTYVYDVDGEATVTSPLSPGGQTERQRGEQRRTASREGDVYTWTGSGDQQQGRSETRERWLDDRVELIYFLIEVPGFGRFECAFDPPIITTRIPIRPGAFETQTISGAGNVCEGTVDINVVGETTTEDAHGRSWRVWEVDVRFNARGDGFETEQNDKQWFSPDLGISVRTEGTGSFRFESGAFTARGTTRSSSVLKSWP